MSVFYKVTMNGVYQGKDNRNILWYRSAIDPLDGTFNLGGAPLLADLIESNIEDEWLAVKPSGYTLQSIDIYPISEVFSLLYQLPYRLSVDAAGTNDPVGGYDGTAICVNMRFNLEPVLIGLDALTAPRTGYIALGPVPSAWVQDNGQLTDTIFNDPGNAYKLLANKLSMNLSSIVPPALFFPIRVSAKYGVGGAGGGLIDWGYADVSSATIDKFTSYRRSRRIRG